MLQIEKFQECLEMLADLMHYHHHSNLSMTTPAAELSQHRIAYMGTVVYTVHLLQIMVPLDKVSSLFTNLPSEVTDDIFRYPKLPT